jgi:obg-like ATPase 1
VHPLFLCDVRKCSVRSTPYPILSSSQALDGDEAGRAAYLEECKGVKSMLPKIITTGYHALNLIHYFTCGSDEVRAWTIKVGTW